MAAFNCTFIACCWYYAHVFHWTDGKIDWFAEWSWIGCRLNRNSRV